MKKSFLAILFCMAFTAMFAQNSLANKAKQSAEKMAKSLELSEQQMQHVRAAYYELYVSTSEARKNDAATRAKKQNEIQSKFDTDLAKVLSPEQNRKWNETRQNRPSTAASTNQEAIEQSNLSNEDRITRSSNKTVNRMTKQLGLNETQRNQILEAHKKKLTDIQALRDKKTPRNQMINLKKAINKNYQATVDGILTAEQIEKRKIIRAKRIQQNNNKLGKDANLNSSTNKAGANKKDIADTNRMENQATLYTERMIKKLDLQKDQIGPFKKLFLDRITAKRESKMSGLSDSTGGNTFKDQLKTILTKEQYMKFDAMHGAKADPDIN